VVSENVFLKFSLTKGIFKFRKKGKLSPRFIRTFEILKKVGAVAYKLALLPSLSAIHLIFHMSMLRKYLPDSSHVLKAQPIELRKDMSYEV
jgi:hypothetical protein